MKTKQKLIFAAAFTAICGVTTAIAFAQEHHASPAPTGHETSKGPGVPEGHALAPSHAGSEEHGAAAHEEGGHHALEPLNWTDVFDKKKPAIIALLINAGVLFGLYYALGKKPVSDALKQRRVTIAKDIEDAAKRLKESQEREDKYQGELKNVSTDTATVKSNIVTATKADIERLRKEAIERADRMKRDASRLVEQEKKQLQEDILRQTVERSLEEAKRVLEQATTADDHKRLADDLLGELAKIPAAARRGAA